ncbi:glycine betaine ABC transporter substrate-binding protein OsmF [Methylobacterium phyllosphaerae]
MVKRNLARLAATALLLLVALPDAWAAGIVVASKLDTEGGVLGNIILQALKAKGLATVDRIQLGATSIVRQALIEGQVDIYPEYTGNAAFFFGKADLPVWKDPDAAYQTARSLDRAANDLIWLTPASANNTWAIAVRQDVAQAAGLKTMSDFGRYVAGGGAIKLAASSEFVTAPAALPAFGRTYGFALRPEQLIILAGGDTAATIAAAARGTSGTNAAMVFGTDGGLAVARLTVMADDKGVQPVYQPAPVVRGAVLKAHPEIATVLDPIFRRLDLATLRDLNGRVQIGGEPASAVAADFLSRNGFVP